VLWSDLAIRVSTEFTPKTPAILVRDRVGHVGTRPRAASESVLQRDQPALQRIPDHIRLRVEAQFAH
jgi:hypothetical protein